MQAFIQLVFDNWHWLIAGGATAWLISLAIPENVMPSIKLAFRVVGRLGFSVPLAIVIGIPAALFLGFAGSSVMPIIVCLIGTPALTLWAIAPLSPMLKRYIKRQKNCPLNLPSGQQIQTRSSKHSYLDKQ